MEETRKAFSHAIACGQSPSTDHVLKYYDQIWAKEFDKDISAWNQTGYNIYSVAIELLKKHIGGPDYKILDVAGGTGYFGQMMRDNGLTNIYMLDGSKEMIKIAQSKEIYKEIFEEILEPNTQSKSVPNSSFDVVIALNCFYDQHLGQNHIPVLLNMLRLGGKLIMGQGEFEGDRTIRGLRESICKLEPTANCKLLKAERFNFVFDPEKQVWEPGMFYIIETCN